MNYFLKTTFVFTLIIGFNVRESVGHGMLMDPVNRGSAWRDGFDTPINYNDNENYCGGYYVQHIKNKGKCGLCGDSYTLKPPRPNENGGIFGTGTIVKTYSEGQNFSAKALITANHGGYFEFSLCPLALNDIETEECFSRHPIYTTDGNSKFSIGKPISGKKEYKINLMLPSNVTCSQCSLRWQWTTANNWGICTNGTTAIGCGAQETFRTCSDIKIIKVY